MTDQRAPGGHGLTAHPSPFVGRDSEAKELEALLSSDQVRLLTLTGPGGIGKSRLALEVALRCNDAFADGVGFASLAAVSDPELVAPTIARALDVVESAERSVVDNLKELLRTKELLLVLDNFEHVLPAGPMLQSLLSACPRLKILVTSRAVLYVRGEHELRVPTLPVPTEPVGPQAAGAYDSIRLFVERARAIDGSFSLTVNNAAAVAEICACLDGLPLAIELAAAHTRSLEPAKMLARLSNRFELLTGGPADFPERQQTLRATLDWDYDLLSEDEQLIFRRTAAFAGGFTAEAAEVVIGEGSYPTSYIVDVLESLADKSLLRREEEGENRFSMLNTLREYGFAKLDEASEKDEAKDRHAAFFLDLAEHTSPLLRTPEQVRWLSILDRENDNMCAALTWTASSGNSDTELRLAVALADFWEIRAHLSEGQRWLEEALARGREGSPHLRVRALEGAGILAGGQGEYKRATHLLEQSIALAREIGDDAALAGAIKSLGVVAYERGDYLSARASYEESLELMEKIGNDRGIAEAQNNLGVLARLDGDLDAAAAHYNRALEYFRERGDKLVMGGCS